MISESEILKIPSLLQRNGEEDWIKTGRGEKYQHLLIEKNQQGLCETMLYFKQNKQKP